MTHNIAHKIKISVQYIKKNKKQKTVPIMASNKIQCDLINIQSVGNKMNTIRNIMKDQELDICMLTETWLSNNRFKKKLNKLFIRCKNTVDKMLNINHKNLKKNEEKNNKGLARDVYNKWTSGGPDQNPKSKNKAHNNVSIIEFRRILGVL